MEPHKTVCWLYRGYTGGYKVPDVGKEMAYLGKIGDSLEIVVAILHMLTPRPPEESKKNGAP